jgi:hypothetical protein
VDRIENLIKEEVAIIKTKLDELARAVVFVDTYLNDLKRAFRPSACRPSGTSRQSGAGSDDADGDDMLLRKTVDNVYPSELMSACCSAAVLSMWKALCLEEQVQEVVLRRGGDAPVSNIQVQHCAAERFVKALFFSFTAKHTMKAYAEQDGIDHTSLRCRLVKLLLVNAAQREEVTSGTPFWLKKHAYGIWHTQLSGRRVLRKSSRKGESGKGSDAVDGEGTETREGA